MTEKLYLHHGGLKNFTAVCYFHISRKSREFYQFDETLFAKNGNVVLANFYAARVFAEKMNRKRDLSLYPERAVRAGQINAMGLLDEMLHHLIQMYREETAPKLFAEAIEWISRESGEKDLQHTLLTFIDHFPPPAVQKGEISAQQYLDGETEGTAHREITLEELLMLFISNANPALDPFEELFDDSSLSKQTPYRRVLKSLQDYLATQPAMGGDNLNLMDILLLPARKHPHSLRDQIEFLRSHWGIKLAKFTFRIFSSIDLMKEEEKPVFDGPGPTHVPDFAAEFAGEHEPEQFSPDLHWMPNVVMLAKSTYVWLDQLSKKYQRPINKLDQVPNEELQLLAQRGFNTLWLIGLWERSNASQKIKQWTGNPEAVSSAYSLFDYVIAWDLGGPEAMENLKQRAARFGIRMASDMVPNHTGIFSKWMLEHPDWFVQLPHPPFPNYRFTGGNLSEDPRMAIYIEDGYWNRTDAAVVFRRVDLHNGHERFIYHGNDGTSMPWNDTAQLNFLLPEVREAVIQTILHVARQFPVIRLDAAMTLAKRHFQRLWFPQPGSGGDIPSRAEHALTQEQFNAAFPVEFWREVVDRVAAEAPDTLLLAEAFWMMEGYFVRTLGMHRVYNSAFMNMLKNEENQKYRQTIKNTMDFNPEILKRYVNFMNNPDEETAVVQFGKGDKYFGICTLMATMPGLPMFGHGQVEGYSEKYGMEYKRAYWDETEDRYLVERHERDIFPLLKKRYLFSEVANFVLYDFVTGHGVNENVFAHSNRAGDERALVIYNNSYDRTDGWVRWSSATAHKNSDGFVQVSVTGGLDLPVSAQHFIVFRDLASGLEFIRESGQMAHEGIYAQLDGFQYHVFMEFRAVYDHDGSYRHLCDYLAGRGVPSVEAALREILLRPLHEPFRRILQPDFISGRADEPAAEIGHFISALAEVNSCSQKQAESIDRTMENLAHYYELFGENGKKYTTLTEVLDAVTLPNEAAYLWALLNGSSTMCDSGRDSSEVILAWFSEFMLYHAVEQEFSRQGKNAGDITHLLQLTRALLANAGWLKKAQEDLPAAFERLWSNHEMQEYVGLNRYENVLYFNRERFESLLAGLFICDLVGRKSGTRPTKKALDLSVKQMKKLSAAAEKAGYRLEEFRAQVVTV